MEKVVKFLLVMFLLLMSSQIIMAQPSENSVTLVTSGEGETKDDAIKNALRNAIEQTYGTFISANTEVLDDELIRDEIVTVSSGNVSKYKEVDSSKNSDGTYNATVEATVSIGKLTKFAKSKGLSVDIETGAFAMNMKIRELNKENEIQAIKDLQTKLLKMSSEVNFFDYKLDLSEPFISGDCYAIKAVITITPNSNLAIFRNTILSTLKSLSLSESEQAEYKRANIPFTRFAMREYATDEDLLATMQRSVVERSNEKNIKLNVIALRNTDLDYPLLYFPVILLNNELKCMLKDNTNNYYGVIYKADDSEGNKRNSFSVANISSPVWPVFNFHPEYRKSERQHYVYTLASTIGSTDLIKSHLFSLNQNFEIILNDLSDPLGGNPTLSGPAILSFAMSFPKEHFSKISDISIVFFPIAYHEKE